MGNKKDINDVYDNVHSESLYYTQKEVADRFRVTQSTVKNWRKNGLLKYFQAPGSRRILYPVDAVMELELKSLKKLGEVIKPKEVKRERLELSPKPEREWRI